MALGKTDRYLQLRSFNFVALHDLVAGWPGLDKGTLFLVPHVWKSHTHHSLSLQEISSLPKNR